MNIGNPTEITIGQLAEIVLSMTGSRSKVIERPMPIDDPRKRQPDISMARQLLNWEPRIPLAAGLEKTIAHFADTAGKSSAAE